MSQIVTQTILYLADFSKFTRKYFGDVGLSGQGLPKLHYSWLVIIFLAFAIFLIALNFGRSRMLLALVSLYAAAFLETHFIFFDKLKGWFKVAGDSWSHILLFLVIYLAIFIILNRSVLKQRLTIKESSIFAAGIIALLEIGLLASILLSYLPATAIKTLPPKIIVFFDTKTAQFWWAILPLAALIFMKRKKET